jgi:ABC-type dipeptide/oligopeptide/nickel transport system permease component
MSDRVLANQTPAAAARGIPPARWLWVHVARHAVQPVLGVYGVIIGGLCSGSLAVETVTAWPGLGRLLYEGLVGRDAYLTAGCVLVGAFSLMVANLGVDLVRMWMDPQLRPA